MFVLRCLFWFAVVALLMPRGPDLGLDIGHPGGLPPTPAFHLNFTDARTAVDALRGQTVLARPAASDPVERYREAIFDRLGVVRAQLAADRLRRGDGGKLIAIIPAALRE